jgi:hypothetical protein
MNVSRTLGASGGLEASWTNLEPLVVPPLGGPTLCVHGLARLVVRSEIDI